MQRVPTASLSSPASTSTLKPLVPIPSVPYAESRDQIPTSWSWSEAPAPTVAPHTSTFAPLGYEKGYKYPLIVWLHGDGASESSLPDIMRHVSLRNFVAVAPRGGSVHEEGFAWCESDLDSSEAIFDAIEHATEHFNVHDDRIFLAGSGAGGSMAMRVALRNPERFAGVATLDGQVPRGGHLLARADEIRQLPLLLSASKESPSYSETQVCHDLSLLHSAGCQVAVRQYPGDDDLTTVMLEDLNRWAMEIVCTSTQTTLD